MKTEQARIVLVGTQDWPIRSQDRQTVEDASVLLKTWWETETGHEWLLDPACPYVHQLDMPNGDNHTRAEGTVWYDPFRYMHHAIRSIGFDPWGDNTSWLVIWRGGGGMAMGFTRDSDPADDDPHTMGFAIVGDWGLDPDNCFDRETLIRLDYLPKTWPARLGGWAHEMGHTFAIGPHIFLPDNVMGYPSAYSQFPNCTLTEEQRLQVLRTGLFGDAIPLTPECQLVQELLEDASNDFKDRMEVLKRCTSYAKRSRPLPYELAVEAMRAVSEWPREAAAIRWLLRGIVEG